MLASRGPARFSAPTNRLAGWRKQIIRCSAKICDSEKFRSRSEAPFAKAQKWRIFPLRIFGIGRMRDEERCGGGKTAFDLPPNGSDARAGDPSLTQRRAPLRLPIASREAGPSRPALLSAWLKLARSLLWLASLRLPWR